MEAVPSDAVLEPPGVRDRVAIARLGQDGMEGRVEGGDVRNGRERSSGRSHRRRGDAIVERREIGELVDGIDRRIVEDDGAR